MKKEQQLFFGASPTIFGRARLLRKRMTQAEKILWHVLRNRKENLKFRRQHPIGKFIVDFYCHKYMLVIELDGEIHNLASIKEYDKERQQELEKLGLKIIRFKNEEIYEDLDNVINKIKKFCK